MSKIILSLENDLQKSRSLLSDVREDIGMIQISSQMLLKYGDEALSLSKEFSIPLFLDLKLNDMPSSVQETIHILGQKLSGYHYPHLLSIHCFGGKNMCKTAVNAAAIYDIGIVGVGIMNSIETRDLYSFGGRDGRVGPRSIELNLRVSREGGVKNFMCGAEQVKLTRQYFKDAQIIATGIREPGEDFNDHLRVKPINFALKNGANWVLIGRPIHNFFSPQQAVSRLKLQSDRY
jgi:orotidine-5'-phosphate decarboxylase